MKLEEFLKDIPPSQVKNVECRADKNHNIHETWNVTLDQILMHCDECNGDRNFIGKFSSYIYMRRLNTNFITYTCKNCNKYAKIYAVCFTLKSETECEIYKFGELPPFGSKTPSKVFSLIGEDKSLFLKGRNCENQGFGIGAFAYYRRVIENQKNRIIDEIIKVLLKTNSKKELVEIFEKSKKENQFSKSIEMVKDVLPSVLFIDNHNPLTLLHDILSKGIHNKDDEKCLELAKSIRVLLFELSFRIVHILKEKKELNDALSSLLNKKNS